MAYRTMDDYYGFQKNDLGMTVWLENRNIPMYVRPRHLHSQESVKSTAKSILIVL